VTVRTHDIDGTCRAVVTETNENNHKVLGTPIKG